MKLWQTIKFLWRNRDGHKAIPVMEWFPAWDVKRDEQGEFQVAMQANEFHPKLYVCRKDQEEGNIHRFYTMEHIDKTGWGMRMTEWRKP